MTQHHVLFEIQPPIVDGTNWARFHIELCILFNALIMLSFTLQILLPKLYVAVM